MGHSEKPSLWEDETPISEWIATAEDTATRLDLFLASQPEIGLSRARLQQLIRAGAVTINGKPVKTPKTSISPSDHVALALPEPEAAEPEPEAIPLDILFEDEDLIVINKPAGLVVHPGAGNWQGTLVNALLHHCAGSLSGIGGVKRPGIVHRLDKETSGVMVVAKNDIAHQSLAAQFADHGRSLPIRREYRALIWGETDQPTGMVETFLGRDNHDRLKRAVVPEGRIDAKHARTHYRRLQSFAYAKKSGMVASDIACVLETGRTHQIRVHMAHIHHPLIGDPVYGRGFATKAQSLPTPLSQAINALGRQALHAAHLSFTHPRSDELMAFDADLPQDIQKIINEFKILDQEN